MFKQIIVMQKIAARKSIVQRDRLIKNLNSFDTGVIMRHIQNERDFLSQDFDKCVTLDDLRSALHIRHKGFVKDSKDCSFCKKILAEDAINVPGGPAEDLTENPDEDVKPMFGNLIAVLEQQVQSELDRMGGLRMPSQNDLTRWALKDSVLEYYKSMQLPPNTKIVETVLDDRLLSQLAPDFDVIARLWMQKLYDLTRREDKYKVIEYEYDKSKEDLSEEMQGSAFEKQLDRYRKEFMQQLMR